GAHPSIAEDDAETLPHPAFRHGQVIRVERVSPHVIAMIPPTVEWHSRWSVIGHVTPGLAGAVRVGPGAEAIGFAQGEADHLGREPHIHLASSNHLLLLRGQLREQLWILSNTRPGGGAGGKQSGANQREPEGSSIHGFHGASR